MIRGSLQGRWVREGVATAVLAALSVTGPWAWADDLDDLDDPALARASRAAEAPVAPAVEQTVTPLPGAEAVGPEALAPAAPAVVAVEPAAAAPATVSKPAKKRHRYLGAIVDFGPPDFLGAAFVGRPLKWMRLHLGMVTNFVAPGIRAGVTFVPVNYYISPSITVEGGKMWEGNANTITSTFGISSRTLERFGYDFMNAHLGIELGAPNRFLFFIHAGVSYMVMRMTEGSVQEIVREQTNNPTLDVNPRGTSTWTPSGKIGFALYL